MPRLPQGHRPGCLGEFFGGGKMKKSAAREKRGAPSASTAIARDEHTMSRAGKFSRRKNSRGENCARISAAFA